MHLLDDPYQFDYKSNMLTLEAFASLIHHICKFLDKSMMFACCFVLDHSSTFDSVPRSVLSHKLEKFGYSRPLLAWLFGRYTNRTEYTRLGGETSKSLVTDRGALQGTVLSCTYSLRISVTYQLVTAVTCLIMLIVLLSLKPLLAMMNFGVFPTT